MSDLGIGKLIVGKADRDAIHVAVAPMIAGLQLDPGQKVGVGGDGRAYAMGEFTIGVVDPFLSESVEEGQQFWLFLPPGSITSLKHQ